MKVILPEAADAQATQDALKLLQAVADPVGARERLAQLDASRSAHHVAAAAARATIADAEEKLCSVDAALSALAKRERDFIMRSESKEKQLRDQDASSRRFKELNDARTAELVALSDKLKFEAEKQAALIGHVRNFLAQVVTVEPAK